MLKLLRVSVSVLSLSAVVIAPTVTALTFTVLSADQAYAKNGNGGGNGGGNSGGNGGGKGGGKGNDGGNGKSGDKGHKGKSSDKAKGNAKGKDTKQIKDTKLGKSIKSFFNIKDKPTKSKVQKASVTARTSAPDINVSTKPMSRPKTKGVLHPSNLGKLNGALNSSPNAKLAHIKNGNFNGPVGLAAALAVADFGVANLRDDVDDATATLTLAAAFALVDLIADSTLDGPPTEDERLAAAVLSDPLASPEDITAATELLGPDVTPEQLQAITSYPEVSQEDIDVAIAATEETDENGAPVSSPTVDEIADATVTLETYSTVQSDVKAAEDAILAEYKGTLPQDDLDLVGTDGYISASTQVLNSVRDANPDAEAVRSALPQSELETPDDDVDAAELETITSEDLL